MDPIYNLVENITACENSSVIYPDGTMAIITASTSYTSNLTSGAGCDSIIVTNVTMNPIYNSAESVTLCSGEGYTFPDGTFHSNITVNEVYTSSLTSVFGCDSNIVTSITVSPAPVITAGVDQSLCEGTPVTLSASGGVTYVWDNGVVDGAVFTPTTTMTYTVTGIDVNGCLGTDVVTITVNPNPTVDFMGDLLSGCVDHTVNFTYMSTPGFDCFWDFGDGTTTNTCGDISHTYTSSGLYSVSLTITSTDGCTSSMSYTDLIEVYDNPVAGFGMSQFSVEPDNMEVEYTNYSLNSSSYEWTWSDGTSSSFEEHPIHEFNESTASGYTVTLYAFNGICVDSMEQFIPLDDVLIFYVPNVFTPDNDDINNTFFPVFTSGYDPYDYHLMIFNRWGELIFESYNAAVGWDGTYGDGGLVQDGVYVWKIDFRETMSDKRHEEIGHVTVLK
jgi:gliding motility-associated-like protein